MRSVAKLSVYIKNFAFNVLIILFGHRGKPGRKYVTTENTEFFSVVFFWEYGKHYGEVKMSVFSIPPVGVKKMSLSVSTGALGISIAFLVCAIITRFFDVLVFTEWTAAWRADSCSFGEFETAGKTFCRFYHERASERTLYMFQVAIDILLGKMYCLRNLLCSPSSIIQKC